MQENSNYIMTTKNKENINDLNDLALKLIFFCLFVIFVHTLTIQIVWNFVIADLFSLKSISLSQIFVFLIGIAILGDLLEDLKHRAMIFSISSPKY
jgi:hypothetical protein